MSENVEKGIGEIGDPVDGQQEGDAHEHRQRESDNARLIALIHGQAIGQDRDENDIVDAEHDFERGQCQQRDPDIRVCQQIQFPSPLSERQRRRGYAPQVEENT